MKEIDWMCIALVVRDDSDSGNCMSQNLQNNSSACREPVHNLNNYRSIKKSAPIQSEWMVTKPAGPSCQVQHAACCCLGFWIPSQAASRGSGGFHFYELGHRHVSMQERTTAILLHQKWFPYGKSKVAVFLVINSLGISRIYSAL